MTTKHTKDPQGIYQIKVVLVGTEPSIWRRLLVPAGLTLAELHDVLQIAMGWYDCHLHEFRIGDERFCSPYDLEDDLQGRSPIDERTVCLSDVLKEVGAEALYTYDFGDSWDHRITVEKIAMPEPGVQYPLCTEGKLHCPPEDCGGVGGFYDDFLEAISDPKHDEHEEMLDWAGGSFDPESFSLNAVNQRLQRRP